MEQWRYVPSKFNPADHASCGLGIADAEARISTWIHESKVFMAKGKHLAQDSYDICKENPEVKHSLKTNLTSSRTTTLERLERISTWSKIK